jgi:hypothetical protein
LFFVLHASAQCVATSAELDLTLTTTSGGTNNRSGVVFDPIRSRYYSVNAGSADYPVETYDASGTLLSSVPQGFDYRGAWWNPALSQFEGNGFANLGIFVQNVDPVTGHALGSGTVIFNGNQPNAQSVGDLDHDANEIIYYFSGAVHRYDRATNALLGTLPLSGLPVPFASLNSNSVIYTGCVGSEIGVYNFQDRRLLFIDKATGAFSGECQLPPNAPPRSSFGMSFANGLFWLYNDGQWFGYGILSGGTGIAGSAVDGVRLYPNPATSQVSVAWNTSADPRAEVRILDMLGRMVHTARADRDVSVLDVAMLPAGAYVVQCIAGQRLLTGHFVKE